MSVLYVVSTPIGNLSDVSERAIEALSGSALILAEDTRRSGILLDRIGVDRPLRSLHEHNEASRVDGVVEMMDHGSDLALISDAGTPLVSDPGQRLVDAVLEAGHRVVPIPGPSAVLTALAGSGFVGDRFVFLGFPPRRGRDRDDVLERVARSEETVILFESPERLLVLLSDLGQLCGPDRRVCVAREMTKLHEEFRRGTIPEVSRYYEANPPRGEIAVVVEGGSAREEPDEVDREAARALARALLGRGTRPSTAVREIARRLGLPRNLAYELVHSLDEA